MAKLVSIKRTAAGFCGAFLTAQMASAQTPVPATRPPDSAALFEQQCATSTYNKRVGSGPTRTIALQDHWAACSRADGFHYSDGFVNADYVWDDTRLDAWPTNPQAVIPGAVMAYRQSKPEIRAVIIAYLKEFN